MLYWRVIEEDNDETRKNYCVGCNHDNNCLHGVRAAEPTLEKLPKPFGGGDIKNNVCLIVYDIHFMGSIRRTKKGLVHFSAKLFRSSLCCGTTSSILPVRLNYFTETNQKC